MKKITFLLIALYLTHFSFAQCIESTEFPASATTSTNDGFVQQIAFNNEAGEFATINSLIIGDDYEFTSTRTAIYNDDYITITDEFDNHIAWGYSPLTVNSISATIIRMHISLNADCNNEAELRVTTIQSLTNAPTCYKPESPGISFKSHNRIDFFWSAPSLSTPIGYDWEIVSGNTQGVDVIVFGSTATTSASSSGEDLAVGTSYSIFIRSDCDTDGVSIYLGPLGFTTNADPPPENDFCAGATSIVEETGIADAASATPTAGTLLGGAGTDVNAELCNSETGNARDDVWFSFLAQTTDITITFEPSSFDGVLTLYSGNCNALVYLDCSDVNGALPPLVEEINYSGLTIGLTYFTRVYHYDNDPAGDPTFNLKIWSSTATTDSDGDGFSVDVDCDDGNVSINPGATDIVANGVDEDCDGMYQWYQDSDGDGYGSTTVVQSANTSPGSGEANNSTDCDDSNASINPEETDIVANGVDEDCDGMYQWYQDSDGDGYGSTTVVQSANTSPGSGEANNSTDCDDTNSAVNPGETEILNNGIDDDCNPLTEDTLAVNDFNLETLVVKPNPFNQRISVHLPLGFSNDTFEIKLFDLNGRLIFKQISSSINGIINIDNLESIQQGAYFIKIINKNDGKSAIKQLIKY